MKSISGNPVGNHSSELSDIGEPFFFKSHSPDNYIVGGGFFSHSTILPASIVWQAFGEKNGAQSEEEMRSRIARYRRAPNPSATDDYQIGCILLESPFFLVGRIGFPYLIGNGRSSKAEVTIPKGTGERFGNESKR